MLHTLHVAGIEPNSVVDGPGIRYTIFTQGCPHHCEGCHNPQTWDTHKKDGFMKISDIIEDIGKHIELLHGVTLSGGDPMYQPYAVACLINEIKSKYPELDIWVYTGYLFEDLLHEAVNGDWDTMYILDHIDMLVDGRYEQEKRDLSLNFRGSSNQRLIDKDKIKEGFKAYGWESK